MKKSFFKKLSFVMAAAMTMSLVAPAAGAFAATAPKLNSAKKYLYLDVEDKNDYNFNITTKKGSGWNYLWESSDEDVAVVDEKNGVTTATGIGTAKVTVFITDKDGEEVGEASATVIVKDNIASLKVSNLPAGNKLGVGKENDFGRTFVTVSGSTTKTSAITRWSVEPADGATISDSGLFVATKAGEYTITGRAFQSKEKYASWLTDATKYADYVLATDSAKVTVAASMTGAKQLDLDTVNVTFDAAMTDVNKNISVYQIVGDTKVKQLVSKVEMDADKKVASVSLYIPFTTGATYTIEYPGMDAVSFKAATTNAEDVASMKIDTTSVVVTDNDGEEVKVKLFNAEGVEITTPTLLTRVTMKSSGEAGTWFNEGTKVLLIFEKGKMATISATYHTYKYDNAGNEIGNVTAAGVLTGVDAAATNITGLNAWTIVDYNATPNFGDVKQVLAADDSNKRLFVKLNNKTGNNTDAVDSDGADAGDFNYTSSDESILIIDNSGNLYPVKEGVVTVVVKYATGTATKVPVAVVPITVSAKNAASNFTLSTYEFSLSNTANLGGTGDNQNVKLTMKDQLGRAYNFDSYKIERLSAPVLSDGTVSPDQLTTLGTYNDGNVSIAMTSDGTKDVNFNANGVDKGTYVYKITVKDIARVVTVNVLEANDSAIAYYKLSLGTTSQDMNITSNTGLPVNVSIKLFGYSSNGVKLVDVPLNNSTDAFRVEVDAPYDSTSVYADINNLGTQFFTVAKADTVTGVTGSVIHKAPVGSYKVTAYEGSKAWDTAYFSTTDSQTGAVLADIKSQTFAITLDPTLISTTNYAALITAVSGGSDDNNGLKFKVNGASVPIVAVEATGTATSIAVKSVTVRQLISGTAGTSTAVYLDHKVNVGLNFTKR